MTEMDRLSDLYAVQHGHLAREYESVMDAFSLEGIVIFAGEQKMVFQDDEPYPFRISPFYLQWIPETNHTGSLLVLRPGRKPRLICHQPADYWFVVPDAPSGFWADHFDIVGVGNTDDALDALPDTLDRFALLGEVSGSLGAMGFGSVNDDDIINRLHYMRLYKTDYEVECIRRASRVAARGHVAARDAFYSGKSEFGIHLAYLDATRQTESHLPYGNIVALNEHCATLHYDAYDKTSPLERHSFLIDAGARFSGYASDITRTWTEKDGIFADLLSALDLAQQALIADIRPGQSYIDLHLEMHHGIACILADAGIVSMDAPSMVDTGVTFTFFPHGLGHHLGLQVHDVGGKLSSPQGGTIPQPEGHPFLRNLREVEEGNLFTVEPGIYMIPQLLDELRTRPEGEFVNWSAVHALLPFGGIRIEDDVLVTPTGPENLTRDAFAELQAG